MICKECEPLAKAEYKNRLHLRPWNEYQQCLYQNIGNYVAKLETAKELKREKRIMQENLSRLIQTDANPHRIKALAYKIELLEDPENITIKEKIMKNTNKADLHKPFHCGKYKHRPYGWILKHDKNYARWASSFDDCMKRLYTFVYEN